jgi:hypothetical protein
MLPRLLRHPWHREIALFLAAYMVYGLARYVVIGDTDAAVDNAHRIVDLEQSLAVDVESAVQDALSGSAALWLLNHLYIAAQFVVVPGALVWLYRRSPEHYRGLRNTVLATWLVAVPIYALFPVAPPRLADIGLVDTITTQTGIALDSKLTTALYNPLAAVPSLHAGFAFAVSAALAASVSSRRARLAAWLWALVVGLAVVATGNHFVFDIAAGIAVTVVGYALARALPRLSASRPALRPLPAS